MDARHCTAAAKYGAQQAKSPQPGGGGGERGEGETTRGTRASQSESGKRGREESESVIVAQSSKGARLARIACWPEVLNRTQISPARVRSLSRITLLLCTLHRLLLPLQHALAYCHVAQMLRTSAALSAQ